MLNLILMEINHDRDGDPASGDGGHHGGQHDGFAQASVKIRRHQTRFTFPAMGRGNHHAGAGV